MCFLVEGEGGKVGRGLGGRLWVWGLTVPLVAPSTVGGNGGMEMNRWIKDGWMDGWMRE